LITLLLAVAGCSAILTPAATTYPLTEQVDFAKLAQMKRGESCARTILYLFGPNGRASVEEAAKAGGLSRVVYVDNRYDNNVLRQQHCVIAYGE
jgi:hypothetical protein